MLGTRLYSATGTLRCEDRQLRFVARSRINSALAQLERKYDALASQLARKCKPASMYGAGDIITRVRTHSWLAGEFATINRYTESFPELKSFVDDKLARIESHTRRLAEQQMYSIVH